MSAEMRHALGFSLIGIGAVLLLWSYFVSRAMRRYVTERYPQYEKQVRVAWWRWKPAIPKDNVVKQYLRGKQALEIASSICLFGGASLAETHWFIY